MAKVPTLERLYECGDVLANAKGLTHKAHKAEYEEILLGVKGDDQCKRLSSQFIGRFFPHFPDLCQQSIDAMLDLCEDVNTMIRMQAIKDMPNLCRDSQIKTLPKIADVLTQLLQSEDRGEISVIESSLMTLIRRDTKAAIIGIFSQVHTGEEIVRERALRLVHTKLKTNTTDLLNREAQAQLIAEIKKVFASATVTGEEFPRLMAILNMTYLPKSTAGQTEMATMVTTMADLDMSKDFDYASAEAMDRLLQCATHALPYFSASVPSTAFAEYLICKVLPHYYQLSDIPGADTKTALCKLTAEMCLHLGKLTNPGEAAKNVFDRLIDYMPLPPVNEDGSVAPSPSLEFTKVEALMFAFHRICRQAPTFLPEDEERLKDFKLRLQYLARGVTGYIGKLREFLKTAGTKAKPADGQDDVKVKQIALRTNENIQTMIKDLFHSPPIYKASVTLSFKERSKSDSGPAAKAGEKRKPITFYSASEGTGAKQGRTGGMTGKFGGMRMDGEGAAHKKRVSGGRPTVSAYKPGGKVARPTGQYKAPQGKYSSKVAGGVNEEW